MRIRYFAWIKDITKKDDEIIDINHPKTLEELKEVKSIPNSILTKIYEYFHSV